MRAKVYQPPHYEDLLQRADAWKRMMRARRGPPTLTSSQKRERKKRRKEVEDFRNRSCTGKAAHATYEDAEEVRSRLEWGWKLHAYGCVFCDHWHLGNPPKRNVEGRRLVEERVRLCKLLRLVLEQKEDIFTQESATGTANDSLGTRVP